MPATVERLREIQSEAAYHKRRLNYHKRQLRAVKQLEAQYASELQRLGIGFKKSEGDTLHGSETIHPKGS